MSPGSLRRNPVGSLPFRFPHKVPAFVLSPLVMDLSDPIVLQTSKPQKSYFVLTLPISFHVGLFR